jgi:hypothetical protein
MIFQGNHWCPEFEVGHRIVKDSPLSGKQHENGYRAQNVDAVILYTD